MSRKTLFFIETSGLNCASQLVSQSEKMVFRLGTISLN